MEYIQLQNKGLLMFTEMLGFFITLFAVLNPLSSMIVFLSFTKNYSHHDQQKIAILSSLSVLIILLVVTWVGVFLLNFFGITASAFKMGGALILLMFGLKLLGEKKLDTENLSIGKINENIAVVPLAMPIIAGPAAIATIVSFVTTHPGFMDHMVVSLVCIFITLLLFIILFFAPYIVKVMGREGIKVFNKIMGMILMAMGMQMFVSGLRILLPGLAH